MLSHTPRYVGIDVSKAWLDVASRPDGQELRVRNNPEGIAELVTTPGQAAGIDRAGGHRWPGAGSRRALVRRVAGADRRARPRSPLRRSIGQQAKTDTIDARVLAHYAEAVALSAGLPDEATRELQALLDRRRQLVEMRVPSRTV